jgi:hypothetical protein
MNNPTTKNAIGLPVNESVESLFKYTIFKKTDKQQVFVLITQKLLILLKN